MIPRAMEALRAILFSALLASPLMAEGPATPSIKVTGVAEERVPADQLSISCSIRTIGGDLAEVAAANRARAAEVTKILRGLGLGEEELKTGAASFGEDTEYKNGRHIRIGFEASTAITITTGKLELYDPIWLGLAKFPEVSIQSAEFGLADLSKVRATARRKALLAARAKAKELADTLDARIGAPLKVVENPPRAIFSPNINRNSIDSVLSAPERESLLEPGLVSVVEQVEAVFELIE